mmetsp:Transcript_66894/g.146634  ORF Transcript_66894/g.146634 Transcript_66894/m.146634 type:complete len:183 (+) Transcript_66894:20-568(+)
MAVQHPLCAKTVAASALVLASGLGVFATSTDGYLSLDDRPRYFLELQPAPTRKILQKRCQERGLRFSGTKAQLAQRLQAFDKATQLLETNALEMQRLDDLRVLWGLLCRRSSKSIESLELVDLIRRLKGFLAANGAPQPGSQVDGHKRERPLQQARARQIGFMMAMAKHCQTSLRQTFANQT